MKTLAAIAIALTLAACTNTALTGPSAQVTEARGLAAGWASLDAVSNVLDGLATSKVLVGKNAALAATGLNDASAALQAATVAYNHGDNTTAAQQIAAATVLISSLISISQHPAN